MAPSLSKLEPTGYEAHKHPSTYQLVTERVLIHLEEMIPKTKKKAKYTLRSQKKAPCYEMEHLGQRECKCYQACKNTVLIQKALLTSSPNYGVGQSLRNEVLDNKHSRSIKKKWNQSQSATILTIYEQ